MSSHGPQTLMFLFAMAASVSGVPCLSSLSYFPLQTIGWRHGDKPKSVARAE